MIWPKNRHIFHAMLPIRQKCRTFINIVSSFPYLFHTGYNICTVQRNMIDCTSRIRSTTIFFICLNENISMLKEFYRMSPIYSLPFQLEAKTQLKFRCLFDIICWDSNVLIPLYIVSKHNTPPYALRADTFFKIPALFYISKPICKYFLIQPEPFHCS